jgi:hypothetical protein
MIDDAFPPRPGEDASWDEVKRYANVCLIADVFLNDSRETSKMLGGTLGALTPEQAWAKAEAFYDREIGGVR